MMLFNYINDLLYRYDCVIVPNFGGFVTNRIGARIYEHTFYPPTKQVSFNTHLKHNDGLLANYISDTENISFDEANKRILNNVESWKIALNTKAVSIGNIGKLSLNSDNQIVFEPNLNSNFLTTSFGLNSFEFFDIERVEKQENIIPLVSATATENKIAKKSKKEYFNYVKYAAAASILLTLGVVWYQNIMQQEVREKALVAQQEQLQQKIQQATFVIETPLPTIKLNVLKNTPIKTFHIIAGAFQSKVNATKKMNHLIKKGFDAEVLGKNKWGLTIVSYGSYFTDTEAKDALKNVKKHDKEAWLLIKKF